MRIFLLYLLLLANHGFSQKSYHDKYSASLKLYLSGSDQQKRFVFTRENQTYISVFLEMNDSNSIRRLTKHKFQVRTIMGNIATADVPVSELSSIALSDEIKRIELPLLFRKTDTVMKKMTRADKVLRGSPPLIQSYSGKNVLIGIIDDGIDITHTDFLDSNGRTRIKALWNMDGKGRLPAGYSYGALLTEDTINQIAKIPATPARLQQLCGYAYHGTSVSGLAAIGTCATLFYTPLP